jgi:hypothetical protein
MVRLSRFSMKPWRNFDLLCSRHLGYSAPPLPLRRSLVKAAQRERNRDVSCKKTSGIEIWRINRPHWHNVPWLSGRGIAGHRACRPLVAFGPASQVVSNESATLTHQLRLPASLCLPQSVARARHLSPRRAARCRTRCRARVAHHYEKELTIERKLGY